MEKHMQPAEQQLEELKNGISHCILQCQQLLDQLSDASYCEANQGRASIGSHIRHILDRFECFFDGLPDKSIDYDRRKRDQLIENDREAAGIAVESAEQRVSAITVSTLAPLTVKETMHHLSPQVQLESSVARELMSLITHTTHHLAIIANYARDRGYSLNDDFGKAASTLVFERT